MSRPRLIDNRVYKEASDASGTIHQLLLFLQEKGLDWIPKSYGINAENKHVLSYIPGIVPQESPTWLWAEDILTDAARKLRQLHDATASFQHTAHTPWLLPSLEPQEVVCHNDFAPYNAVFEGDAIRGFIDFDVCSPGPRIWDIAYAVYRFVPLYPVKDAAKEFESSPFTIREMRLRLEKFLHVYGSGFESRTDQVIHTVKERLIALAKWTDTFAVETGKNELFSHATMYRLHAQWVGFLL